MSSILDKILDQHKSDRVLIIGLKTCGPTNKAGDYFWSLDAKFERVNVDETSPSINIPSLRSEMTKRLGSGSFPQVFVDFMEKTHPKRP